MTSWSDRHQMDPELERLLAEEDENPGPHWPMVASRPYWGPRQVTSAEQLRPGDKIIIHIRSGEDKDVSLTVALVDAYSVRFREWPAPTLPEGFAGHYLADLGIEEYGPHYGGGWHSIHYVIFAEGRLKRKLRRAAWRLGYHW